MGDRHLVNGHYLFKFFKLVTLQAVVLLLKDMGDHITPEVAQHLEIHGSQDYIDRYLDDYGTRHSTHRPNFHGFKNTMKVQAEWHNTRKRLQAKLAARSAQKSSKDG